MDFFLYILYSEKLGKYYVGTTSNICDRVARHNGARSMSTKAGCPWKLVYTEIFYTRAEAVRREGQIKKWKSKLAIREHISKAESVPM